MDFSTLFGTYKIIKDASGQEWKLAVIGLGELAEYINWYRYAKLREAETATKFLPEDLRREELSKVYKECKEAEISPEMNIVLEDMQTPAGLSHLLYLSLKINYPSIKEIDVSKIFNIENQQEVFDNVNFIVGLGEKSEGEAMGQR
ncbi:MAG: hypothetical protein ACP5N7_03750 [Candidatus Pacearchaeota archaeon]